MGQSVTDTTITSAKFVATTATDGVKAVSQGFKDTNANVLNDSNKFEPTVEAASINSVSQPTSLPSVEQGFESAKNKIGSIINLLRDKAISKDNTQDNKKESPSAQIK